MRARAARVGPLFSFLALLLTACGGGSPGGGDGGVTGPRQEQVAIEGFNAALVAYIGAAGAAHVAALDAVRVATYDFVCAPEQAYVGAPVYPVQDCIASISPEVNPENPAAFWFKWVEDSTAGLAPAVLAQRRALARAHALYAASGPLLLSQSGSPLRSEDGEWGTNRQPLIFITLGAIIGAVMINRSLNDTMDAAVEARTEPVRKKIQEANETTLTEIKEELGLDPSASREETLAWYEKQPVTEKLDNGKRVEMALGAKAGEADIEFVDPQEIGASVAQSAQICGEAAVTNVAGWVATGAGGQGVSQVAGWLGAGEGAAFLVDTALTVAGVQPLDLFAMAVSRKTEPKTVAAPPAAEALPLATALEVLVDDAAPGAAVAAAADVIIRDVVRDPAVAATTLPDGSVVSDVPEATYVNKLAQPTANNIMTAPNLGAADLVIGATDCVPDLQSDVLIDAESLTRDPLVYEARRIDDFVDALYESPGETPDGGSGSVDGGGGGGGGTPTGMYVTLPPEPALVGRDVALALHCGAETTFPATLAITGASATGVSTAWGSPIQACPVTVLFNADTAATYNLGFTLTGASGERQSASVTLVVHAGSPTCDQGVFDACYAAADPDTVEAACMDACRATVDETTEQRDWEICWFRCDIASRGAACSCGNQSGCTEWTSYQHTCCVRGCQIEDVNCLEAIDPETSQDFFGNCHNDLGTCWNACPAP